MLCNVTVHERPMTSTLARSAFLRIYNTETELIESKSEVGDLEM